MNAPRTLQEAIIFFANQENCNAFMTQIRWPDGKVRCPICGAEKVTYLEKAKLWKCYTKHPKQKFSLKVGTIFEDSPLGLDKWLVAVWMVVNCKNGISSYEVARDLGITQKSAWHMLHRIRLALQNNSLLKLSGEVECDETFIGGKVKNMHDYRRREVLKGKTRGIVGKAVVQGLLERGGKVRAKVVNDTKAKSLKPVVRENVEAGAVLYTDEHLGYWGLDKEYAHQVIKHAEAYVDGAVHTNGIENFWSLLKRGLNGTYVNVEPFHLFRYLDEQVFRFNERKMTDGERFRLALTGVVGKRLTWDEVTGKSLDPQTCTN